MSGHKLDDYNYSSKMLDKDVKWDETDRSFLKRIRHHEDKIKELLNEVEKYKEINQSLQDQIKICQQFIQDVTRERDYWKNKANPPRRTYRHYGLGILDGE
jgi:hypothetical protein